MSMDTVTFTHDQSWLRESISFLIINSLKKLYVSVYPQLIGSYSVSSLEIAVVFCCVWQCIYLCFSLSKNTCTCTSCDYYKYLISWFLFSKSMPCVYIGCDFSSWQTSLTGAFSFYFPFLLQEHTNSFCYILLRKVSPRNLHRWKTLCVLQISLVISNVQILLCVS